MREPRYSEDSIPDLYERIKVKSALQKLDRNREFISYKEYNSIATYLRNKDTYLIGKRLLDSLIEKKDKK